MPSSLGGGEEVSGECGTFGSAGRSGLLGQRGGSPAPARWGLRAAQEPTSCPVPWRPRQEPEDPWAPRCGGDAREAARFERLPGQVAEGGRKLTVCPVKAVTTHAIRHLQKKSQKTPVGFKN